MIHTKEIVTKAIKNASSVSVLSEEEETFEKVNEPLRDAIVKAVVDNSCDFHLSQLDKAVEYELKVLALDFPLKEGESAYTAEDTDTLDCVANTMIIDAFRIYIDTCELVNDTNAINLDAVAARAVSIMFGNHGKLNKSIIEDKERLEKEGK